MLNDPVMKASVALPYICVSTVTEVLLLEISDSGIAHIGYEIINLNGKKNRNWAANIILRNF